MGKVIDARDRFKKKKEDDERKFDNLDGFLDYLHGLHAEDLDAAFKEHDDFTKEENMQDIYVSMFAPGQDDLYATFSEEMKKVDNKTELSKKEHEKVVDKAMKASLEKYFEKVQPSVLEAIKDMDDDEAYDHLILSYDDHVGAGQIQGVDKLKDIIDTAFKEKKSVAELKTQMYQNKGTHSQGALQMLQNDHANKTFSGYKPAEVAAYLKPLLKKEGAEIEDKSGYATAKLGDLIALRRSLIEKKGHKYLKKKEMEEAA